MGTYFITAKIKPRSAGDASGRGMYLTATAVATNYAGQFRMHKPIAVPPPPPPPPAPPPVPATATVADNPLNAGHIAGFVTDPSSASAIWITAKGAVADGASTATDNITAIRDAISAAALTTHKNVFVPAGDYAYGAAISLSGVSICGNGPTSILRATDLTNRAIFVKGSSATVQGVQLLTNSAAAAGTAVAQAGIVFDGATNFLAFNTYIKPTPYGGIVCQGSAATGVILQNTVSGNFAPSIRLTGRTRNVLVKLNHVDRPADDGISIASYQADLGQVSAVEASYNWIQNNTGGRCMTIVGGRDIYYHNNLLQSNAVGNGIYVAQESSAPNTYGCNSISVAYCTVQNCGNVTAGAVGIVVAAAGGVSPTPIDAASAFAAAAAGSILDWTNRSYSGTLTINKAITIKGLVLTSPANSVAISVTSPNVILDGLTITGPQSLVFSQNERGIYAVGSSGGRLAGLQIKNCRITNFGNACIETDWTTAGSVTNNICEDSVYMGIIMCSPLNDTVTNNTIRRVGVNGSTSQSSNAYGITLTSNNPPANPQPRGVLVDSNLIETVPTWHGLDTHAGISCTFSNNIVRGAWRGVFITSDGASRRNSSVAVNNNRIEAAASNDRWGIQWVFGDNGTCLNNNLIGWPSGSSVLQQSNTGMNVSANYVNSLAAPPANNGATLASAAAANANVTILRCDVNQSDTRDCLRYYGPQTSILFDQNKTTTNGNAVVGDANTAGVAVIPYASGNVGYLFTSPSSTESPDNTTIPPQGAIVDSGFHVWTVSSGIVYRDGVATISSNVILLVYQGRRVYQENNFSNWWYWDDNTAAWVATTDPRVVPGMPTITTSRHPADLLQVGNPAIDAYWVEDNRWGQGTIIETINPSALPADGFPRHVLAVYYEAYNAFNQTYPRIQNIDPRYNVIYLFNGRFNADGSMTFPFISSTEIRAVDVQTCRNRGQKVILTVGGAGLQFDFQTRTQSDNFISSFQTIYTALGGVDGIDFNNYEQITITSTFITEMVYIAGQLKALYGTTFGVTSPPAPTRTGGAPVNGISMGDPGDLSLMGALADAGYLTYAAPQYYDWSFFKQVDTIHQINQQWVNRLGASRVVIGLGAGNYNTGAATTLSESNREWDQCLSSNAAQRGVYCWNASFDNTQAWAFAANFKNKFSAIEATNPIVEGPPPGQFSQKVERDPSVGSLGEVAFRTQWSWPTSVNGVLVDGNPNYSEVKGYPSIIYGAKPGYKGTGRYPAFEKAVRMPDGLNVTAAPADAPSNVVNNWIVSGGSVSVLSPSGAPPGDDIPKQLLISANGLVITGAFSMSATGKCHLACDIWLQAINSQTAGFLSSPITHEIMVPLRNFGGYGMHGNRDPSTYDHDVVLDTVQYHVYCAKNRNVSDVTGLSTTATQAGLRYNFGRLNPNYTNEETGSGRIGWKFIILQHDGTAHPLQPDGTFRIDLGKILNYLTTRTDSRGVKFVQGTEWAVSVELGVEMVMGDGDLTVWRYKVQT